MTLNDPVAEVILSTSFAITSISIFYSNGPDDATYEQNNVNQYAWWSNDNGATNGASDGHAIRVDGLQFCACPDYNIAITEPACTEPNVDVTFTVSSNITPQQLYVDGTLQASTSSFSVSQPLATSYEIVLVDTDGCKDVITYTVPPIDGCCPPVNCIRQYGEFTIIKNTP